MAAARTRFDIEITPDDVEKAHQNDSYKCMVVRSIARTVPDAHRIEVDTQSVRFTLGDRRLEYRTPMVVSAYVIAFDAGDPMGPFGFRLQNPTVTKRRLRTDTGKAKIREQKAAKAEPRPARTKAGARDVEAGGDDLDHARTEPDARPAGDVSVGQREAFARVIAMNTTTTEGTKQATARVFKSRRREYGHRTLRINQQ